MSDAKIIKRMREMVKTGEVTRDNFLGIYIGEIMFLYVDTYGLPEKTVKEVVLEAFNNHSMQK